MNKLINSKAKLVSTILDNGYSIAKKKINHGINSYNKNVFKKYIPHINYYHSIKKI